MVPPMSRTDRLENDLERAFTLLEEGEVDEAAAILERCKRIDRRHEGVISLAAAIADAQGDTEEALAMYHALIELHPDDAPPRLAVARLELHDVGDPDAALVTLDAVTEFIDDESDLIDAVMLRAEAYLARDEAPRAREALGELSSSVIDDPGLALDLGELSLAADDHAAALRWIDVARKAADAAAGEEAETADEVRSDALHLLGRVHEAKEERVEMIAAWAEVAKLDAASADSEVTISEDDLEALAVGVLEDLPPTVREKLANVPILIEDVPSAALLADGVDPRVLGLFSGTPMPEGGDLAPTVTNIHLFRKNLERIARDEDHLAEEVRITVLHETAHYFGLDEDELADIGLD